MVSFLLVFLGFVFLVLAVFLILIILVQPGKSGGGIGGLGGGSAGSAISETLGATQGEKTLSRWTGRMAGAFFTIALLLTLLAGIQQGQPSTTLELPSAATQTENPVPELEEPAGAAGEAVDVEIDAGSAVEVEIPTEAEVPAEAVEQQVDVDVQPIEVQPIEVQPVEEEPESSE